MSLNIKNTEAYDLARELARLTGHSMTTVVLEALRKQREQLLRQQQKEHLLHTYRIFVVKKLGLCIPA